LEDANWGAGRKEKMFSKGNKNGRIYKKEGPHLYPSRLIEKKNESRRGATCTWIREGEKEENKRKAFDARTQS